MPTDDHRFRHLVRHALAPLAAAIAAAWLSAAAVLAQAAGPPGSVKIEAAEDPDAAGIGTVLPDIWYVDVDDRAARLSDMAAHPAVVLIVHDVGCPISERYGPRIAQLEASLADRDVPVVYLNASTHNTAEEIAAKRRQLGITGPYIHDTTGRIARALGVRTTTEVFVIDRDRTLRYRGAIDDQYGIGFTRAAATRHFLRDAVDAVLAGDEIVVKATRAPGCAVLLHEPQPAEALPLTYHGRISRIIADRCQTCHRDGGVAPFALDSYRRVRGRSDMIEFVVGDRIMPPWGPAPHTGPWRFDRSLTDDDRAALLAWIRAGTPEGDPALAAPPHDFSEADGWQIGRPDALLQIGDPIEIPAEGLLDYRYVYIKTDFEEDRWVQAVEVRPSALAVTHHILAFIEEPRRPGESRREYRRRSETGVNGYFASYVPGAPPTDFGTGRAKRLPAGAWIKLQLHYTPNGTPAVDQTRIGFRFSDAPDPIEVHTSAVYNPRFELEPGAIDKKVTAYTVFSDDVLLAGVSAHMHLRGKAFRVELVFPDGSSRPVLDVPRYDFNWQGMYRLVEPIRVPAGASLMATGWFDNSAENPANPDPTATVRWGEQTYDEMMLGYYEWYRPAKAE